MECLQRRLDETREQIEVFSAADGAVVERAPLAAQSLTRLDDCADVAALRAPVRPPTDATTRREVAALRKQLAKVKALLDTGRYPQALELAAPTVATARLLGYRPVEAEALFYVGRLQELTGDYAASVRTLKDAGVAAEAGRHDEFAARTCNNLVWVLGERLGKYAEAHELAREAHAKIERLGHEELLRADLDARLGTIFFEEAKYDQALEHSRRALAIREKVLKPSDPAIASSLGDLGDILLQLGKYDEAVIDHRRALELMTRALGPDHPQVADLTGNLGATLRAQGKYDEALVQYQRARAIDEKSLGPTHPTLATLFVNLGGIHRSQHQLPAAAADYHKALEIWSQALGPEHPNVATVHFHLGSLALEEGRTTDALVELRRAHDIWQKALGAEHPSLSAALDGIGDALLLSGKPKDALASYARAVQLLEKAVGPDHPDLAEGLTGIGLAELAMKNAERGVAPLERALAVRSKSPGDPQDLARTRFALARALRETGNGARSLELARAARAAYATADAKKQVSEIDAWLAHPH
jgi:tetratricopeptide (TPR) repeat protein